MKQTKQKEKEDKTKQTASQAADKKPTAKGPNKMWKEIVKNEFFLDGLLCSICSKEIGEVLKILCAECDARTCLECFLGEKTNKAHLVTHDYYVIGLYGKPIYDKNWSGLEELMLIKGIKMFGIDNWEDIARYINTKNKKECEVHYSAYYYISPERRIPSPDFVITEQLKNGTRIIPERVTEAEARYNRAINKFKEQHKIEIIDPKEEQKPANEKKNKIGYIPSRKDFEVEYSNDAELRLAALEFNDNDAKKETEMKLKLLEEYNTILDERARRKKFVIEHGLTGPAEILRQELFLTEDERVAYRELRPFRRFMTDKEYKELAEGMLKKEQIKQRIDFLQKCLAKGLTTMDDVQKLLQNEEVVNEILAEQRVKPEFSKPRPLTEKEKVERIKSSNEYSKLEEDEKLFCEKKLIFPDVYLECKKQMQDMVAESKHPIRKARVVKITNNEDSADLIYDFLSSKDILKKTNN